MTLNGNSTSVVKLQLESVLSYNLSLIYDVGSFLFSGPGSGTLNAPITSPGVLPGGGANLVVRANIDILSNSDIGITIADEAGHTGVATIKANSVEGQAFNVVMTSGSNFVGTLASVVCSNGVAGDGFDISVLPAPGVGDVLIAFDQGLTVNPGKEVKGIYKKYNLNHLKRIRGDRTMSTGSFYTNNYQGVAAIHNRLCTFIQQFCDNGRGNVTEYVYIDQVQLGVTREAPSGEDNECTCKGEGVWGRLFIFS